MTNCKKGFIVGFLTVMMVLLFSGCEKTHYPYIKIWRNDNQYNAIKIETPSDAEFVEFDVSEDGYTITIIFKKAGS